MAANKSINLKLWSLRVVIEWERFNRLTYSIIEVILPGVVCGAQNRDAFIRDERYKLL